MKRRQLLITGAIASIGLAGIGGASLANAASVSSNDSLVDKLAERFKLNKDDVQKVFDEEKASKQAEKQKLLSERLQEKVDSGDITAQQKTLIENKMKELQTKRENARKELEAWAKENNINLKYLHVFKHRVGSDENLKIENNNLTTEQRTLVQNKLKELDDQREKEREELRSWAEQNNIDFADMMPLGGGLGHGHRKFDRL